MTATGQAGVSNRPPFWLSLLICLGLTALMVYIRVCVYGDRLVPLADGMPLLVCLWTRDRRLLWGMALTFTAAAMVKILWFLPYDQWNELSEWIAIGMMLFNIGLAASIVHLLLGARERLEQKNAQLQIANDELAASNEELAAREEEVSRQNEQLQSQTEELEQQTEQLTCQSQDLQSLNEELARREKALQMLLESSRWLRGSVSHRDVMTRICQAAGEMLEGHAACAAIVEQQGDQLVVRGHYGFGPEWAVRETWSSDRSFAAVVINQRKTAYIRDISLRPDLEIPQPVKNQALRSLLAAPLWVEGKVIGVLEVYSPEPRDWTDEEFKVVEWLAAQSSLVIEAMMFQQELEQRRCDAEEASVRKTRFLAAVSHDVRTPAYAINLMAELIRRAAVADSAAAAAQLPQLAADLQANARSLVALVSDVLDLARFDSGKLDLQENDFSLCAMVEAEIRQLLPLAQSKALRLTSNPPEQPIWVRTDQMKLARVVGNLIGNAIKFTETGSVQIQCRRLQDGSVQIQVADSGVGIPSDQLPNIFDEFYQLRNPARDGTKGTGLGLAICKRLLDAMGCTIGVQSQPGVGSTFTVAIPSSIVIPAPQTVLEPVGPAPEQEPEVAARALDGLHILLVEDHDMTRRATAQLLASAGAIVTQAGSGREALRMLAHGTHQVLLLDLMLPDMDGTEVLRQVRHRRPPSLRCILVVSGDVTMSRRHDVQELGADTMLAKPIDIDELIAAIRSATATRGADVPISAN